MALVDADKENEKFEHLKLRPAELSVIDDIRHFLLYPHKVQELVSGEKTPTLSVVLPAYEELLSALRSASTSGRLTRLRRCTDVAIEKLETYLQKARRNPVYVLAMGAIGLRFLVRCTNLLRSSESYVQIGVDARQLVRRRLPVGACHPS